MTFRHNQYHQTFSTTTTTFLTLLSRCVEDSSRAPWRHPLPGPLHALQQPRCLCCYGFNMQHCVSMAHRHAQPARQHAAITTKRCPMNIVHLFTADTAPFSQFSIAAFLFVLCCMRCQAVPPENGGGVVMPRWLQQHFTTSSLPTELSSSLRQHVALHFVLLMFVARVI